jgi:hypothetical protein
MPQVVSDLPYDFKKMFESYPREASKPLWQPHLSENPSEGCFSWYRQLLTMSSYEEAAWKRRAEEARGRHAPIKNIAS